MGPREMGTRWGLGGSSEQPGSGPGLNFLTQPEPGKKPVPITWVTGKLWVTRVTGSPDPD